MHSLAGRHWPRPTLGWLLLLPSRRGRDPPSSRFFPCLQYTVQMVEVACALYSNRGIGTPRRELSLFPRGSGTSCKRMKERRGWGVNVSMPCVVCLRSSSPIRVWRRSPFSCVTSSCIRPLHLLQVVGRVFSRAGNVKSTECCKDLWWRFLLLHATIFGAPFLVFFLVLDFSRCLVPPSGATPQTMFAREEQPPKTKEPQSREEGPSFNYVCSTRFPLPLSLFFSAPAVFSPFDTSRPDRLPRSIMYSNGKIVGFGGAGNPGGTDETFFFFSPFYVTVVSFTSLPLLEN